MMKRFEKIEGITGKYISMCVYRDMLVVCTDEGVFMETPVKVEKIDLYEGPISYEPKKLT